MISSIVRRTKKRRFNCLGVSTHERFQQSFSEVNANFYLYNQPGLKRWNFTYAPLPNNHFILPDSSVPIDIDFDFIFSQEKSVQYPVLSELAQRYNLPILTLEHTLPYNEQAKSVLGQRIGHYNVFISDYSRQAWGYEGRVIEHGVDTNLFAPKDVERKVHLLSIVNDWKNRDIFCGYNLWRQITQGLPVQVWGDNPGLSKAINPHELVSEYNKAQVFLNTSLISPVPTVLLEAAACGCAIVTTGTCAIPDIFINGYNCLMSNDPGQLKRYCELTLSDKELCLRLGANARQTVVDRFGVERFTRDWDSLLEELYIG